MLSVENLCVSYGQAVAVEGISFSVEEGTIVTLLGSNGAGKTSTLRAISGIVPPAQGTIEFLGERIDRLPGSKIVRKGIAHVPEGRKIFSDLTVMENLIVGGYSRADKKEVRENIEKMFELFPRLKERRKQRGATLSGGEQQMLAFARALVSSPRLLLLDEPSMGLAPLVVQEVKEAIVRFKNEGFTVLLVEQNASIALSICDKAYVLESGRIMLEGTPQELLENEDVKRSYLGI
jgi:branched-chain amino acid transport system ATP-binding protein